VACPQPLNGHLALTGRVRPADVVLQVGRRLHRHVAHGAAPFLARRRRDYCQAEEYQDAAQPGRRAALRSTPDGAGVREDRAPHQSGRLAQLGRVPVARWAAEPPSAASGLPAHLVAQARLAAPLPVLRRPPSAEPARVPPGRHRPSLWLLLPGRHRPSLWLLLPGRHRPSLWLLLSLLPFSAPAAARSPASP
jgi:hypothetical protein